MAEKTKVERQAETAAAIAKAVEEAMAAWSPIAGAAVKGIRMLVTKLKNRGVITPEDAAEFDADIAESEAILATMDARAADYKARRAAEQAAAGAETAGQP